jgi:hypothetical protein
MPLSWAIETVVEVELGRDIGSSMAGGSGTVDGSSFMTDRIGGRAGDATRVGSGAMIGGRLSALSDASVDAVLIDVKASQAKLGTQA